MDNTIDNYNPLTKWSFDEKLRLACLRMAMRGMVHPVRLEEAFDRADKIYRYVKGKENGNT